MRSLLVLSLAFTALTLLIVGVLACCLRQRQIIARRAARERADCGSAWAGTAPEEE
jgi:hypothetical protein